MEQNELSKYLEQGYAQKDIEDALTMARQYSIPVESILAKCKKGASKTSMTQSMSNITVSGQLDKQQVASQVVSAPGSEVYDVKTSMVSLVRCKSMAAKKNKRTIYMLVSEENTITTDSTTSDGKPIMVLEQEFYLPLMNLIKSAEAKLRMVQQQLDNVTIERDLYKTTLDTLKTNGIIN